MTHEPQPSPQSGDQSSDRSSGIDPPRQIPSSADKSRLDERADEAHLSGVNAGATTAQERSAATLNTPSFVDVRAAVAREGGDDAAKLLDVVSSNLRRAHGVHSETYSGLLRIALYLRSTYSPNRPLGLAAATGIHRELVRLNPSSEDALDSLGACLLAGGQHEEARAIFSRLSLSNPADADNLFALSRALTGLGKTDEASALLKRAARAYIDIGETSAAQNCASMLRSQGESDAELDVLLSRSRGEDPARPTR